MHWLVLWLVLKIFMLFLIAVHGFINTSYAVQEYSVTDTRFQLNVKGTTQLSSALVVTGVIAAEFGSSGSETFFFKTLPCKFYLLLSYRTIAVSANSYH